MQLVFTDTPGFFKPKDKLGEYMVEAVNDSISGVEELSLIHIYERCLAAACGAYYGYCFAAVSPYIKSLDKRLVFCLLYTSRCV